MFDYKHVFTERGGLYNRAVQQYPAARAVERELLIERLGLRPGNIVCDAPAGGGYLAQGITQAGVRIICVEPSQRFADGIDQQFERIVSPLENIPLADGSVDRVGSLAGLHHLPSKMAFYREAYRLLAPGGRFAVADVQAGSPAAIFLNGPCNELSETGHDGEFLAPGELTRDLTACGFVQVIEEYCQFTWNFPDHAAMARFVKDLFGLTKADESRVMEEIRRNLSYREGESGVHLDWSLVYAAATR